MTKEQKIILENEARNTVGYREAEDKKSFMIGLSVGMYKAEAFFEAELKRLRLERDNLETAFTEAHKDLETLSQIIDKWSSR